MDSIGRILYKSDIDKWNERLVKSGFSISLSGVCISILQKNPYYGWQGGLEYNNIYSPPSINYRFSYSICDKSKSRFDDILQSILKRIFKIKLFTKDSIKEFDFVEDRKVEGILEKPHKLYGESYTHRIYNFAYISLLELIHFITCVEDSISILQKYYEFDEDEEICKVKYPIGSIVSTIDDKSSDYIVQDLYFGHDEFDLVVSYQLCKLLSPIKSQALMFSEPLLVNESQICNSRDHSINIILN